MMQIRFFTFTQLPSPRLISTNSIHHNHHLFIYTDLATQNSKHCANGRKEDSNNLHDSLNVYICIPIIVKKKIGLIWVYTFTNGFQVVSNLSGAQDCAPNSLTNNQLILLCMAISQSLQLRMFQNLTWKWLCCRLMTGTR